MCVCVCARVRLCLCVFVCAGARGRSVDPFCLVCLVSDLRDPTGKQTYKTRVVPGDRNPHWQEQVIFTSPPPPSAPFPRPRPHPPTRPCECPRRLMFLAAPFGWGGGG